MFSCGHLQIRRSVIFYFIYGAIYSTYKQKIISISKFPRFILGEFELLALPLRFLIRARWIQLLLLLISRPENILRFGQTF